jgi:hypothetical protein
MKGTVFFARWTIALMVMPWILPGCTGTSSGTGSSGSGGNSESDRAQWSPIPVAVKQSPTGHWQLIRDGQPTYVHGAGGEGSLELLADSGGNSGRLWGVDGNTQRRLDEAHQQGLSMAVGIWLEHSQGGFDYSDPGLVARQFETVVQAVETYKNHPAVLLWGLGNEMEGYEAGDNPDLWRHVESLAAKIKEIDPHHPTMTVVAEITDAKVAAIHKYCPSLDIIGINSYGGCRTLPERYRQAGGKKPYIVTEFGPVGTWEVPRNDIDAIVEPTSVAKAEMYRQSFLALKADEELCLGSYAFLWGEKQEGTATWFGMLLPNGHRVNAVDTMTELWTGKLPGNRCPEIEELTIVGSNEVAPEATVRVLLKASDPEGATLNAQFTLTGEADSYITGGHFQESPPTYDGAVIQSDVSGATVKMPKRSGLYRLYAVVDDGQNAAATANMPIRVSGQDVQFDQPTEIPFVVYDGTDQSSFFAPTGWMGDTDAIQVDMESTENPQSGTRCIKCQYRSESGWGGVVWQHPHDDWGERPGGKNFSGATRLTFWARGSKGGEKVKFGIGLLGRDKAFWDTTKKEQEFVLSDSWQQFTIDLNDANLQRIKTPFFWVLEGNGEPLVFYLDSIVIE